MLLFGGVASVERAGEDASWLADRPLGIVADGNNKSDDYLPLYPRSATGIVVAAKLRAGILVPLSRPLVGSFVVVNQIEEDEEEVRAL